MTTETRKRREYTEDFKRDAVALVTDQGYKVSEAARSPGAGSESSRKKPPVPGWVRMSGKN
jgi:transposase